MRGALILTTAATLAFAAPAAGHHGPTDCRMLPGKLPDEGAVWITVEKPYMFEQCRGYAVSGGAGSASFALRTHPRSEEGEGARPAGDETERKQRPAKRRRCAKGSRRSAPGRRC